MTDLTKYLSANAYPGRGLLLGRSPDGNHAIVAYFIMGRSENSRNRIFVADGQGLRTQAWEPAKMTDPSLVIYAPLKVLGPATIVSNGDQTDTIYQALLRGHTFEQALESREFEPDAPNYTPRISGLLSRGESGFSYQLSILKRAEDGSCQRLCFNYAHPQPGLGHLIHTYDGDGSPLPAFSGEPRPLVLMDDIDDLTAQLWLSLNAENKVSLAVRFISLADGSSQTRIVNKHEENLAQNEVSAIREEEE